MGALLQTLPLFVEAILTISDAEIQGTKLDRDRRERRGAFS